MRDVPSDYYQRLHAIENSHWWHIGMRRVTGAVLEELGGRRNLSLLDGGCGTGGFLAWASRTGAFERLAGVDISPQAIDFAREAIPDADLRLAPLHELPFDDESFDLVVLNDVLQHVDERLVEAALHEVRRVLREEGRLLVRTNGGRHARRERSDWRLYDGETLRGVLGRAGFDVMRLTHANALLSAWGAVRGRSPVAPTTESCGIPSGAGKVANAIGGVIFRLEARYLTNPKHRLGYGHTLFALAAPAPAR